MNMITQLETETRAEYMLRVAAAYIRENSSDGEVPYDGTICDGYCVADDLDAALEELRRQKLNKTEIEDQPPVDRPRLVRLAGMHEMIVAEVGQIIDWWPPSECCPECGKRGRQRSGAEFQHQNRCVDCGHVWSPCNGYLRIRLPNEKIPDAGEK